MKWFEKHFARIAERIYVVVTGQFDLGLHSACFTDVQTNLHVVHLQCYSEIQERAYFVPQPQRQLGSEDH